MNIHGPITDRDATAIGEGGSPAAGLAERPDPGLRDPALHERTLDAALATSPGGLVYRRPLAPELRLLERDPRRFVVATAFHEFRGDLSGGVVLQAARDGRGRPGTAVCHSGNMVEFRRGGRTVSLDVESHITDYGVTRLPGRVVLRHESRFSLRRGVLARVQPFVRLRHEYAILADSPVLHLTVTLLPEPGVRLLRPRVTTALDNMSPDDGRAVRRATVWTEEGQTGIALRSTGLVTLHEGPARHLAFPEDGPQRHAVCRHLRLCDGGHLVSVKATTRDDGRLHWAVLRYGAASLGEGERLVIREERLISNLEELDDAALGGAVPNDAALFGLTGAAGAVTPGRGAPPPTRPDWVLPVAPGSAGSSPAQAHEAELLALNVKVIASELARARYSAGAAGALAPLPAEPVRIGLGSRVCRQADIEHDWLRHWCGRLRMEPLYHRKVWEDCFVPQALWEAGMLAPGRRGLGFAVGQEPLPAFFASLGVEVVATDLDAADARSADWVRTGQHADRRDLLHRPDLVETAAFRRLVGFRAADMAAIPPDLTEGGFDFLWSVCALEHLGSIEAGEAFVLEAMRCLRPGGVAVHTTEFNLDAAGDTLARGSTVFYQRRHLDRLARSLAAQGHEMAAPEEAPADGVFDRLVDLPPYAHQGGPSDPPHLRLAVSGHTVTSVGLVVRAGGG